jgi:hypothetical protein
MRGTCDDTDDESDLDALATPVSAWGAPGRGPVPPSLAFLAAPVAAGPIAPASVAAAPEAVACATRAGVAAARDAAARAAAALTCRRTRELLLIHASARYCERLAASIEARNGAARKLPTTLADVEAARAAARRSLAAATRDLEATQQRMRAAKAMAEAAISAMFSNRPVNIVGALANCI